MNHIDGEMAESKVSITPERITLENVDECYYLRKAQIDVMMRGYKCIR